MYLRLTRRLDEAEVAVTGNDGGADSYSTYQFGHQAYGHAEK